MRTKLMVLACLACFVTAGTAWADLVGTWKTDKNESLKISFRDKKHIRMEAGPDAYILVSGDKVYMVNRTKGKWKAVDMDEMSGMMKMFGRGNVNAKAMEDYKPHFEPTGRKETIAGYKGEVYRVTYRDDSGRTQEQEMVLSDHPDVKKLNQAWVSLASRMSQMTGGNTAEALERATREAREKGYGGMLRSGDDMILEKLEKPSMKASYYRLPEGVELVHMSNMGKGASHQGGTESSPGASGSSGVQAEDEEDFVAETSRELEAEAKQEGKDSAKRNLKKAIRGLW
jgi:hypothetical protein